MKTIELNDRIVFCDDIIGTYIENNYSPVRYQLVTKNGTYRINDKDYEKIKEYLLSLNEEVEILEEKKIPEKFKINYEIDEENTINLTPATMLECDLACRINEIIDYLDYLKSKGE